MFDRYELYIGTVCTLQEFCRGKSSHEKPHAALPVFPCCSAAGAADGTGLGKVGVRVVLSIVTTVSNEALKTMAADEAKVKALAEYVAGKSAATGVATRGAAAQLASSYSDFISDNSAGKKAMLAEQRQYQELEQLLEIQRPAVRDAATWQARRDAVAAVGAGDSQTASAVAAQLARAREAAAAFSDDSLASSKAEHALAGAAHHFDASIALTNFGVNPPHDDAAGRSQHPRQTDTLPAAGARAHAGLCGVGMKLKMLESGAQITEIVHDSPAWRSALAVGDSIVAVDGDSVLGSSLAQVVSKLMGVEGSSVSVTIATGGCVVLRRHKSAAPVAPAFSAPATATQACVQSKQR